MFWKTIENRNKGHQLQVCLVGVSFIFVTAFSAVDAEIRKFIAIFVACYTSFATEHIVWMSVKLQTINIIMSSVWPLKVRVAHKYVNCNMKIFKLWERNFHNCCVLLVRANRIMSPFKKVRVLLRKSSLELLVNFAKCPGTFVKTLGALCTKGRVIE